MAGFEWIARGWATERREPGLRVAYDRQTRVLTVGRRSAPVGHLDDNESVLRRFLELVAEQRGLPRGAPVPVRATDLESLATILDLDDHELDRRLIRLLGVTATEAAGLYERIKSQVPATEP